ncbi:MAG: cupin domain-containing protein [Anaerolineae bacterium]|nr:cupin domain-containing protein [Anaerolineae bacterium]
MVRVRHYSEVPAEVAAEGVTMRLVIGPREGAPIFNLRVFEVEPGASTPHHSHWWEHEVFVLAGRGVVVSDGGERPIAEGSTVLVPGGEAHHFTNTGEDSLRFICLVPQEWLEGVRPLRE